MADIFIVLMLLLVGTEQSVALMILISMKIQFYEEHTASFH